MAEKTNIQKIVSGINWIVRIYAIVTLGLIGLYGYQKYLVDFEDLVKYTPTVFVENIYEDTDTINFYSFVGTEYDNISLQIIDALFCKDENNLWERVILPPPKEFTLKIDNRRNRLIDQLNAEIGDVFIPDSAETVRLTRTLGRTLAKEDGFSINYDISSMDTSVERRCRLKLYYESKTRFFNLTKSVSFFTHSVIIR